MTALLSPRPHREKGGMWWKERGRVEGERKEKDILDNNLRGYEGEGDDTCLCVQYVY